LNIIDLQDGNHRGMNKSIGDVAWHQFVQFTARKARLRGNRAGRSVVLVAPRNTTKTGSHCGELVPKPLSVRVHVGPKYALGLDQAHSAALNILARGLAGLSTGKPVAGEAIPF
jgi:putative transposase